MKRSSFIYSALIASVMLLCGPSQGSAQTVVGQWALNPSMPTRPNDCDQYQWPETRSACPEVLIKQKHDHTPSEYYRSKGWDTAVTCVNPEIVVSVSPYVPVQYFNGFYAVDQIPYNPPDSTFSIGTRMPVTADDEYAPSFTSIPYPFYFFGIKKEQFRFGANGLITFCSPNNFGDGDHCPYSIQENSTLPWTVAADNTPGTNRTVEFNRTHDAIYGVFEDTDPSVTTGHSRDDWGMYYGIQGEYPCRKIICSWNDMAQFRCNSLHCTYQIVCYEGSNIIEVHVKQRQVCTDWNGGRGFIGIQNANGLPQQRSNTPGSSTMLVQTGSLPAYWPAGCNNFSGSLNEVAYRFTPCGSTMMRSEWYQIFPDGRDSVPISTTVGDPRGYYIPIDQDTTVCHNLSLAYLKPDSTSTYVFHLKFQNANKDWYNLYDTITIGVDTVRDWTYTTHEESVCLGETFKDTILTKKGQPVDDDGVTWSVKLKRGKEGSRDLESDEVNSLVTTRPWMQNDTSKLLRVSINTTNIPPNPQPNIIDTLQITSSVTFPSGCRNFDVLTLYVYPNFDITTVGGICSGNDYVWRLSDSHGYNDVRTYKHPTDPNTEFFTLHSEPGCDSVVRLSLVVDDTSRTIDPVIDCQPYTWLNGRTYSVTNTATMHRDTVVLRNINGCDSTVQLQFTYQPVSARLTADLESFDLDHMDVTLNDISVGNDSRTWIFPSGETQHNPVAYYSIPPDLDEAEIWLVAHSPYGCSDTTSVIIPMNKEHFWLPNAFTPDNPTGNYLFGSTSTQTLDQEMFIYNRYGTLVFHATGVDCKWNGRDMSGNPCPQDAYVYLIRYTNVYHPDRTITKQGTVTLIR